VFLAQRRNLILAGNRAGGRPHLTPNWFCWDGERFYVTTTAVPLAVTISIEPFWPTVS
jgi:hypothetical protein